MELQRVCMVRRGAGPHNCDIIPLPASQATGLSSGTSVRCLPFCLFGCLSVGLFCISIVWQCRQPIGGTVELQRVCMVRWKASLIPTPRRSYHPSSRATGLSSCTSVRCLPFCLFGCLSVSLFCISIVWQCRQPIGGTVELQRVCMVRWRASLVPTPRR